MEKARQLQYTRKEFASPFLWILALSIRFVFIHLVRLPPLPLPPVPVVRSAHTHTRRHGDGHVASTVAPEKRDDSRTCTVLIVPLA